MIESAADPEFDDLTAKISRERGFGCASYKDKCLRRRIAVRMRARGVESFAQYARLLDGDPQEYDLLIDALTINVSKFFRNADTFAAIDRLVIPTLWESPAHELRIWSAGCAAGEEPYSLAILFHRHAGARQPELASRLSIIATDIDRQSLTAARAATYTETAFTDTPRDIRQRYFSAAPPYALIPDIRRLVRFEQRDLLSAAAPVSSAQLIICRNVIIYFDRATQERLFESFADALAPGGVLVLGKVESLLGVARAAFTPLEGRERIFRRR